MSQHVWPTKIDYTRVGQWQREHFSGRWQREHDHCTCVCHCTDILECIVHTFWIISDSTLVKIPEHLGDGTRGGSPFPLPPSPRNYSGPDAALLSKTSTNLKTHVTHYQHLRDWGHPNIEWSLELKVAKVLLSFSLSLSLSRSVWTANCACACIRVCVCVGVYRSGQVTSWLKA